MGADFSPLGGGRIGKAAAFDILAEKLDLEDQALGTTRLTIFRLVHEMGRYISANADHYHRHSFQPWEESWQMLGMLYEGLAEIEATAMSGIHAENTRALLDTRREEDEAAQVSVLA